MLLSVCFRPYSASSKSLLIRPQLGDDVEIFQRCSVAFDFAAGGDFLEQAAHDFAAAGFGEGVGEADVVGFGDGADLGGDVGAEFYFQRGRDVDVTARSDEGDEGLTFQRVGAADDGRLRRLSGARRGRSRPRRCKSMRWLATLSTSSMRPTIQK